jgi:dTDP-4-amino-4,6-dideoxygalactose transaminase
MFYIVCNSLEDRTALIEQLKKNGINAVFHYLSLHNSKFFKSKHDGRELKNADRYSDCLLRLPFFYELSQKETELICKTIKDSL